MFALIGLAVVILFLFVVFAGPKDGASAGRARFVILAVFLVVLAAIAGYFQLKKGAF